jgi:hypothetical protein
VAWIHDSSVPDQAQTDLFIVDPEYGFDSLPKKANYQNTKLLFLIIKYIHILSIVRKSENSF